MTPATSAATAWLSAVPALAVVAGLLVVPGVLLAVAAGLRGIAAVASAPLLSTAVLGATAVVAGWLGVGWGLPVVAVATVLACGAALAVGLPVSRRRAEPIPAQLIALAGTTVAALAVAAVVAAGMSRPDRLSQTFDSVFHLNLIARMEQTGDASPLTAGTLNATGVAHAFYPAVFHAVAALLGGLTHVPVPEAANLTALAIAAVAWPVSMLLLLRVLLGARPVLVGAGAVLSAGFVAMPFLFLGYGVLWPNLLGMALLPAALAAGVELLGLGAGAPVLGRLRGWLLLAVSVPALGLAHPNVVVSLALYLALAAAMVAVPAGRRAWRGGRRLPVLAALAGLAALAVGGWVALGHIGSLAVVRGVDWPATESLAQGLGEGLFNAPTAQPIGWAVTLLVFAGMVVAARRPRLRWLLLAHGVVIVLYAYASAVDTPLRAALTGFWYNDRFRLAAMLPVTAVPLAALGVAGLSGWLRDTLALRWRPLTRLARPTASWVVVVVIVAVASSSGLNAPDHASRVRYAYALSTDPGLVLADPAEQQFLAGLGRYVPPGEVIVDDPWAGTALAWALSGRQVLFPHLLGSWDPQRETVLRGIDQVGRDPAVCTALQSLHARYLVVGPSRFWGTSSSARPYAALNRPDAIPGLRRVTGSGGNALYEITACGWPSQD